MFGPYAWKASLDEKSGLAPSRGGGLIQSINFYLEADREEREATLAAAGGILPVFFCIVMCFFFTPPWKRDDSMLFSIFTRRLLLRKMWQNMAASHLDE